MMLPKITRILLIQFLLLTSSILGQNLHKEIAQNPKQKKKYIIKEIEGKIEGILKKEFEECSDISIEIIQGSGKLTAEFDQNNVPVRCKPNKDGFDITGRAKDQVKYEKKEMKCFLIERICLRGYVFDMKKIIKSHGIKHWEKVHKGRSWVKNHKQIYDGEHEVEVVSSRQTTSGGNIEEKEDETVLEKTRRTVVKLIQHYINSMKRFKRNHKGMLKNKARRRRKGSLHLPNERKLVLDHLKNYSNLKRNLKLLSQNKNDVKYQNNITLRIRKLLRVKNNKK